MKKSECVRVSGPLARYVAGFAAKLTEQGYTDLSRRNQLQLVAHFSRWLEAKRIAVSTLTRRAVDQYLRVRRRTRTCWRSMRGLTPLLTFLGHAAIVEADRPHDSEVVARYRASLVERGLCSTVQHAYLKVARAFLDECSPAKLTPADVARFVRRARPCDAGLLSALRAVLRFLLLAGGTSQQLVFAVPSMPTWKQTSLPRALEPAQARAVLSSCDRRTVGGRRDYLVVLLMLRLGLRACEVAALSLDDIHWVEGEIEIRGKGTVGRLPLPTDVGHAIVGYLRHSRPATALRALFLTSRAPIRAISSPSIVALAGRILRRAGVSGGGHRLRHTAATSMLRRGASLTEIAQVLRHRHLATTAIYAKVDRDALRDLGQRWPVTSRDRKTPRSIARTWPGGAA
ncbi:MAG TPA: tyrosine-type recombinase/integrase [Kofleriaceae bacterium]|nr:tyrosine-type recombinase/integrase [Kofleriaceae bacterium]